MKSLIVVAVLVACAFGHELRIDPTLDWRIVGGAPAAPGQFPYQISLRGSGGGHSCGGSILNNRWILTAAHCVSNANPQSVSVVVGSNTLNAGGQWLSVSRIITHENYNSNTVENDIAVLQVSADIQFSANVQPIPRQTEYIGVADVVLSGWGTTSFPGSIPNDLQFLALRSITNADCRSVWGGNIFDSQICTLTRAGEGACHGDSGGPLTNNGQVTGIVSWGNPCANGLPDVFTRVSSFNSWLNNALSS